MNRWLIAVPILGAVAFGACQPSSEMVFMNRTSSVLAMAPGIVIPPCESVSLSQTQVIQAGKDRLKREEDDDQTWRPDDSLVFYAGIPSPEKGSARPYIVVVMGEEKYLLFSGGVPAGQLPPCSVDGASPAS